MKFNFALPAS